MAYAIIRFNDTLLPTRMTVDDLSTGQVPDPVATSVSGGYDWQGRRRDYPVSQTITAQGLVVGEDTVLSTGSGLTLVDNRGYALASPQGAVLVSATDAVLATQDGFDLEVGDRVNRLKAQVNELRSLLGVEGRLWRRSDDRPHLEEWVSARCTSLDMPRDLSAVRSHSMPVSMSFRLAGAIWRGSPHVASESFQSGVTKTLVIRNGGNTLLPGPVLSIRPTGIITRLRLLSDQHHLEYTGRLARGDTLVIDASDNTVLLNGRSAYEGFAQGPGHRTAGWMPLGPDPVRLGVLAEGSGDITVTWNDAWV